MSGLFKTFLVIAIFVAIVRILRRGFAGSDRNRVRRPARRRRHALKPVRDREQTPHGTIAWPRFAASLGLLYSKANGPRIVGVYEGIEVTLLEDQDGTGTTSAVATPPGRATASLEVYRAAHAERGENLVSTGDREFDEEFVTVCRWPSFARRVLTRDAKAWMHALGDGELSITPSRVVATTPRYEQDADRMRALLELAVTVAREAATSSS